MLRLKTLTIENIGRFVGRHRLDLYNKSNLVQIIAPSGYGKSSIANSIEYLLGTNHIPSTILQSRLTKDPMKVIGEFESDEMGSIVIQRSKSGLTIEINGVDVASQNNKKAEEKLDELLGIPRDLLRKMVHKRQKEGGFFLNMTPKPMYEFLIDILELKSWYKKLEKAELDLSKYKSDLSMVENEIKSMTSTLDSYSANLNAMKEPTTNVTEFEINTVKSRVDELAEELNKLQISKDVELSGIKYPSKPLTKDLSSLVGLEDELKAIRSQEKIETQSLSVKISEIENKKRNLVGEMNRLHNAKVQAQKLPQQMEKVKSEIIHVSSGTCSTCNQKWLSGKDQYLQGLATKLKDLARELEESKKIDKDIESVTDDILKEEAIMRAIDIKSVQDTYAQKIQSIESVLEVKRNDISKENSLILQAYTDEVTRCEILRKEIENRYKYQIDTVNTSLSKEKQALTEKSSELKFFIEAKKQYESNFSKLIAEKTNMETKLSDFYNKKAKYEDMILVIADSIKVIKSYTNLQFQDALDTIAEKATDILSKIPNMSTASIYFEGFKEAKNGSVKEEVSAILTMDGEVDIPIKSLSGGERSSIDLAVDLSVVDLIEERMGKGLDFFILDEATDGLDSTCKEQVLDILKTNSSNKRIVIIDHSHEIQESISDRIFIKKDGQISSIVS